MKKVGNEHLTTFKNYLNQKKQSLLMYDDWKFKENDLIDWSESIDTNIVTFNDVIIFVIILGFNDTIVYMWCSSLLVKRNWICLNVIGEQT